MYLVIKNIDLIVIIQITIMAINIVSQRENKENNLLNIYHYFH